jgi:hypothetical protein
MAFDVCGGVCRQFVDSGVKLELEEPHIAL